jgi:hypothetical protein
MTTENFIVDAPTHEIAVSVATNAEKYRKIIAEKWLGRGIPKWDIPCLLFIEVASQPWAWTYRGGKAWIRGPVDEVLTVALPHEISHLVINRHAGGPLARWADEGIAVDNEPNGRARLGNSCGHWPLLELFSMDDYPSDWKSFYGQSHAVVKYLVSRYGTRKFFRFVKDGMDYDWEVACNNVLHIPLHKLDLLWN